MMIILVTVFAFILEFFLNSFLYNSIFVPLVVITSLVLLQPYFKKNNNRYYIYCFLVGFIYDLVYTGFYFMDASLFLIIAIMVNFINSNTLNNLFVSLLEILLLIVLYRFMSFLFLGINGVIVLSFDNLFKSIYSSLLTNILYGVILYFVLYLISKCFRIKRIN